MDATSRTDPPWPGERQAWIDQQLVRLGRSRTGPIEAHHFRPWATVLRIPIGADSLWFKASASALGHEAPLTQALARWRPGNMPDVLAADPGQGWLLLGDAGVTLRSQLSETRGWRLWEEAMALHAQAQIDLLDRTDEMRALGVWDRRPAGLAAELIALLEDADALLPGKEEGLTGSERERLHAGLTELAAPLDDLPAALYHDDFHDANLFVRGDDLTLADWGDAAVGHPFCPLTVALRSAARRLETTTDDPRVLRLRDAFLEPWTRFAPRSILHASLRAADRRGRLSRALTWYRVITPLSGPERDKYADAVPGWLKEFLE